MLRRKKKKEKTLNCWEYKECGRDKDGSCPAYPDFGRKCWTITGNICGNMQGAYPERTVPCQECEFYKKVAGD